MENNNTYGGTDMENIIFNNYYDGKREEYAREFLFETYGEENRWNSAEDVPENQVWDEMNFNEEVEFDDAMSELKHFFEDKMLVVTGTLGTWRGTFDGGKVMDISNISDCWSSCDYIKIYDEGGHLHIECSHHDGTNHFEVKVLTDKGVEYYNNHYYDRTDREMCTTLFGSSKYSHIPHFAREVYGCKTR